MKFAIRKPWIFMGSSPYLWSRKKNEKRPLAAPRTVLGQSRRAKGARPVEGALGAQAAPTWGI